MAEAWLRSEVEGVESNCIGLTNARLRSEVEGVESTRMGLTNAQLKSAVAAVESNCIRLAKPRLKIAVGAVESNCTRLAKPRLKSAKFQPEGAWIFQFFKRSATGLYTSDVVITPAVEVQLVDVLTCRELVVGWLHLHEQDTTAH